MTQQNCKHPAFTYQKVHTEAGNIELTIVRCAHCQTAIGAYQPQTLNMIKDIGAELAILRQEIRALRH